MRRWASIVVIIAVLFTGCSDQPRFKATKTEAVTTDDGFAVTMGDVTVSGPGGVTQSGTGVILSSVDPDGNVPSSDTGFETGSPLFDISFKDGSQPSQPVTVQWIIPSDRIDDDGLVFVTKNSQTNDWEGLPVTVTGDVASVTLDHFSLGLFGWAKQYVEQLIKYMAQLMNLSYDAPSCYGKSLTANGRVWSVSINKTQVWPCLEQKGNSVALTIYSANGLTWLYRAVKGEATAQTGNAPLKLGPMLTLAVHDATAKSGNNETVLVPGGNASILLAHGVTSTSAQVKSDPELWAINTLVTAIDSVVTLLFPATAVKDISAYKDAVDCLVGLVKTGNILDNVGNLVGTTLTCMKAGGDIFTGLASFFISALSSLVGLVISGVQGIIEEFRSAIQGTVTMKVTSKSAPKPSTPATSTASTKPTMPSTSAKPSSTSTTTSAPPFGIGASYSGSCYVAWPTAPTVTSTSIQMTMSCTGIPSQYPLVIVIYGDPGLPVTPSTGSMKVTGVVQDFAQSGYGMTLPVIVASKITLP